jgi:aryl-alcohol dehydrogenase-like predicted oxidoreductase
VRDIDEEIVPALQLKGLGCVAWSPMASGYLAGKYKPGSLKVQGTRSAEGWGFQNRFFAPNHAEILQTLLDMAKEIGRSPAQTALRWVMDQPFMTSAIVGARNAQLGEALAAGGAPAGKAGEARQGVRPAAPLSAGFRADGRPPQCGGNADVEIGWGAQSSGAPR